MHSGCGPTCPASIKARSKLVSRTGALSIEGQVQTDEYADLTPAYTEYNVGNFRRSFRMSTAIDSQRIEAKMKNGVLELRLPKSEEARPQRIPITVD